MGLRTMNSDRPNPKPDNPRLPSHACCCGHPSAAVEDQAPQILSKREVQRGSTRASRRLIGS